MTVNFGVAKSARAGDDHPRTVPALSAAKQTENETEIAFSTHNIALKENAKNSLIHWGSCTMISALQRFLNIKCPELT